MNAIRIGTRQPSEQAPAGDGCRRVAIAARSHVVEADRRSRQPDEHHDLRRDRDREGRVDQRAERERADGDTDRDQDQPGRPGVRRRGRARRTPAGRCPARPRARGRPAGPPRSRIPRRARRPACGRGRRGRSGGSPRTGRRRRARSRSAGRPAERRRRGHDDRRDERDVGLRSEGARQRGIERPSGRCRRERRG